MTGVSWLWRALRGRSVTFAVLFSCGILGLSIVGEFRHLLSRLGAPWYVWLVLPIVAVTLVARKEAEWLPEEEDRRKWSRWLVFGAVALALLISRFHHEPAPAAPNRAGPEGVGREQILGR